MRIHSPRLEWAYATDAVGSETPLLWGLLVCHHWRYTVVFHADLPRAGVGITNKDLYAVAVVLANTPSRDSRHAVLECIHLDKFADGW